VEGTVITSQLTVNAKIEGITDEVFQELVTKAEKNCPISKLLNATISTTAVLA
jgi:osmotically inducible protein OsmC